MVRLFAEDICFLQRIIVRALLRGNVKEMNIYMNEVALSTFSSFDSGNHPSGKSEPERFYHGFVLGLLVELREKL